MSSDLSSRAARPDEHTRQLQQIGPLWQRDIRAAGERIKQIYLPLLAVAPKAGFAIEREVAYGAHARQVLDVYRPDGASNAPVVVFVHGGAFVRGSKDINGEMYGNVLAWFARHGCLGINVEYRLAPEASYPQGAHDVAAACAWVARHANDHGGDPTRVCLVGHSAGGTHAASYACDPALGHMGRNVRCMVLISARLRADVLPENPNAGGVRAYFGEDPRTHEARSPLTHAAFLDLPVFIINAEYENPLLDVYGLELAWRIGKARRVAPRHMTLADHNHVSIVAHINTAERCLGEQILDFFDATCR
ncbi:MAG: alpha/beta hydrolase [Variovorax sp.]